MATTRLAVGVGLLFLSSACAYWMREPQTAPPEVYVRSAVRELRRGESEKAVDVLLRARERFPTSEPVLRWLAELDLMRWQGDTALDLLQELSRAEKLETVSRAELQGQIGDLLFRLGKYGESAQYLRSGAVGPATDQRKAKAFITLGLPYVRREIEFETKEIRLLEGKWPALLGRFGDKDHFCVLDTGSSLSAFAVSMANDVGVTDVQNVGLVNDSLGRKHGAWTGIMHKMSIGGIELAPMPVLILDDERMSLYNPVAGTTNPLMGIIGLDVLSRFRFVLDMPQKFARLERPRELTARSVEPCLAIEGCLALPVVVDGVKMWFILDTAASHSSLTKRGLRDLPRGGVRAVPDFRSLKGLGSAFVSKKVTGLMLQTSAVDFTGIELPIVDRWSEGVFPVHGVLGVDLLRYCRLTLDGGQILLEQVAGLPGKAADGR